MSKEFSDELDVVKDVTSVHSEDEQLKNSDYIYAKLGNDNLNKEEKYVTEMTTNATLVKELFENIKNKLEEKKRKYEKWQANEEEIKEIDNQINKIETIGTDTYNSYMRRVRLILILRRNKTGNYIIDGIFNKINELKEDKQEDEKMKKTANYISEKLKKEQTAKQ